MCLSRIGMRNADLALSRFLFGEMSAKYVLDFVGSEGSAHGQVPLRDEAR